jgi:hypothetical protein
MRKGNIKKNQIILSGNRIAGAKPFAIAQKTRH